MASQKLESADSDVFEDALETLSLQSGQDGYVDVYLPTGGNKPPPRTDRYYGTANSETNLTAGLMTPHSFDFDAGSTSSLKDALTEHVRREATSRHSRTPSDASEWVISDGLTLSANEAIPNATDRSDSPTLPSLSSEETSPAGPPPQVSAMAPTEEEESDSEAAPAEEKGAATVDPSLITTSEKTLDDEIAVTRRGLHFFFNSEFAQAEAIFRPQRRTKLYCTCFSTAQL